MKKTTTLALSMLLLLSQFRGTVRAESDMDTLYKYEKTADGSYGYNHDKPVAYYNGSKEIVSIPNAYVQKKEQFKSSWIATIFNLHFPQLSNLEKIKEAYTERLDRLESMNMNAVIFQVRPVLDAAFYESKLNPASIHFTGKQGLSATFDPMPWMIEETHKRGMEFHAWFNPYRVTNTAYDKAMSLSSDEAMATPIPMKVQKLHEAGLLADSNFAVKNPQYVLEYSGKLFLNPGEPAVIQHVIDTISEYISKYDTDAVHFDDYFYPYKASDVLFGDNNEDIATFTKYADGETDIEVWRRNNVTKLIDGVKKAIDTHNKNKQTAVQFGISPFGIWEHKDVDARGSNTPIASSKSYSKSIFADTYQWVKDNKLDYIAPQIYWSFANQAAPYGELARWWNNVAQGTDVDVYVGHASYKYESNSWDADWNNSQEINNQLRFNQTLENIKGSAIYSYNDLIATLNPTKNSLIAKNEGLQLLKKDSFSTPSLTPSRQKLSHHDTVEVDRVLKSEGTVTWRDTKNNNARFYVVYAGDEQNINDLIANPKNIMTRVMFEKGKSNYAYTLPEAMAHKNVAVSVLDRAYVESSPVSVAPFVLEDYQRNVTISTRGDLSEAAFIKALNIKTSAPVDITTDFNDAVDTTKAATYQVKVTVSAKNSATARMMVKPYSESFEVDVEVLATAISKPDTKNPDSKEETPAPNQPKESKPGASEQLPSTGVNSSHFVAFGLLVASLGWILILISKKRQPKAS